MSFKITNNLQSAANIAKVVYANQQPSFTTDVDDEIAYFKDGVLTSSTGLTYDGETLGTDARISADGRIQVNSSITDGSFLAMASDSSTYIDFGSTGPEGPELDARIISSPDPVIPANKNLAIEVPTGNIQLVGPVKIGSPVAPAFKLDYGFQLFGPVANPQATVNFTPGIFTSVPPSVFLTTQTYQASNSDQFPVVEGAPTLTSFVIQYLGTPPSPEGARVNYLAIGL